MTTRKICVASLFFVAFFVFAPSAVLAKDEWIQVRSKNFFLVGNASEKEIRKVATRLEQFRETFRLVFSQVNLTSSVPTNVVVFKSASSYKPFKPKRADGKADTGVAGYFQSGEDVNYITLSTEGTEADTFGTIFHEYVHFIIDTNFGKSDVPPWFNEGLAEYYQTFAIEEDQRVKLGAIQNGHLQLLQQTKLIPLSTLFSIDNRSLHQNGNHSRSIFYAQAWALIHYLVQSGKTEGLSKFLINSIADKPAEQAFQEAFGIGYAQMEKELRKYVSQSSYVVNVLTFKNKLVFDTEMQASPLSEADSNAYLGDLLYHTHRIDDAEPFLRTALSLNPESSMANTSLGMVKIRQRKFDEAKGFLEKAIAQDPKNHLAFYRYAYLLSRADRDEFGYVNKFETATATKIRDSLKKAIALNPSFAESYELLAFVNLVNNEELDDAVTQLQKALKYQPGNMRYAIRIAEIYLRQQKFKEARSIAEKLARTADDEDIRSRAESLANGVRQQEEMLSRYENQKKEFEKNAAGVSGPSVGDPQLVRRRPGEDRPTSEEISRSSQEFQIRGMNQSLRPLEPGEIRVLGRIIKVECKGGITYSIKTDAETFQVSSKDFQTLAITTFVPESGDGQVGCGTDLTASTVVATYRPAVTATPPSRGELVAIEFVPSNFRFVDLKEQPLPPTYVVEDAGAPPTEGAIAEQRRSAMIQAIRDRLRQPAAGEKRELGFIEKSECTNKGMFFHLKVGTQVLRLTSSTSPVLQVGGYTPEIEYLQIGCGMKAVEIPVVFVFNATPDAKAKTSGVLLSLEFVPKTFTF